ncbi:hypothetical protein MKD33_13250, partial [Chromobacterium piscinae]
GSLLLGVS